MLLTELVCLLYCGVTSFRGEWEGGPRGGPSLCGGPDPPPRGGPSLCGGPDPPPRGGPSLCGAELGRGPSRRDAGPSRRGGVLRAGGS